MNIIASVDKNWAIGFQGRQLTAIPEEQKLLREETHGKTVIMSRKTLERLPGGQPLYGRTSIVLTRDQGFRAKGTVICHSVEDVLEQIKDIPSEDIFVIGGGSIFRQFLPLCNVAHITYVDYAYHADVHFPDLKHDEEWTMVMESEEQTCFDLCYFFQMYVRKT